MARHLALGEAGEELAAKFLAERGLRIVDRRVRCRDGELDLVARDGREWVFVEVKTRSRKRHGTAVEAVTVRKVGRIAKAMREYVCRHQLENEPMRCDVVAIDLDVDGTPAIRHYPAAFLPE